MGPTRAVDRKLLHCNSRDQRSWMGTEHSSQQVSLSIETAVRTVLFFPRDSISAAGSFVLRTPFVHKAQENIIRNCHVIFLYESVFCVDWQYVITFSYVILMKCLTHSPVISSRLNKRTVLFAVPLDVYNVLK